MPARSPAALVHGDDFYRVMEEERRARLGPEAGAALYYDWERMRREAVEPLRGGEPAVFHPYDWATGRLAATTTVIEARPIVVVEGLFVSRPELADLVDYAILVESPPNVRTERQRTRNDAPPEWLHRWEAAERWFFHHARPRATFDLVIDGSGEQAAQDRARRHEAEIHDPQGSVW